MPQPMFKNLEHKGAGFRERSDTDSLGDDLTRTLSAINALLQKHHSLEEKVDACVGFQQTVLNALHHLSVHLGNQAMQAECAPQSTVSNRLTAADDACASQRDLALARSSVSHATAASETDKRPREQISTRRLSWSALRAQRKKRAIDKSVITHLDQRATVSCDVAELVGDRRQYRKLLRKIVQDQRFDLFFGAVIVLNAVCLGVQVDIKADGTSSSGTLDVLNVLEYVFSFCFSVELVCRIVAAGLPFFYNQDWTWNLFDFLVVTFSFLEVIALISNLDSADSFQNFSIIRVIRAIRIIRVLRVLRLFNFFRPLRILVYAIAHTLRQCFWAMMLLCLLLFLFGIIFCQVATDYREECNREQSPGCKDTVDSLNEHYKDLSGTLGSLFMAVTGGMDWKPASVSLLKIHWIYCVLFVGYISFVYFAMMNVVTGLFCQTALESVQADTDNVIAEKMKQKDHYASTVRKLCSEIDESGDGQISIDEFTVLVDDPRLNSVLKSIDIDVEDAWVLFELLDVREAGVIEVDDFVDGCLRLKGQAKGVHIHQLIYENKWIMAQLTDIIRALDIRGTTKK